MTASPTFERFDLAQLRPWSGAWPAHDDEAAVIFEGPVLPLGGLVYRPTLRRRNGVAYVTVRSWRADVRRRDLDTLKAAKRAMPDALTEAAARELAEAARMIARPGAGWSVTCVACGHSRRPDCFGKRLAMAMAGELGLPFVQVFADRFVAGVSHPKEYRKLPPLDRLERPTGGVLLVDDLVTSGWHIEEAATALRETAAAVIALAWIGGTVK